MMKSSVSLTLEVLPYDGGPDARCPACRRGWLDLHQPDERSPDRLLATCGECGCWLLVDVAAGAMIRLPDPQAPPRA